MAKNMTKEPRRIRAYAVSDSVLMDMMTVGYQTRGFRCIDGVPQTAMYSHVFVNPFNTLVYFVFVDDSFDIVPIGEDIPIYDIQYELLDEQRELRTWQH